jgi:hypothetical protein
MNDLMYFGDSVKAEPDGKVRGYLVRFGGEDLVGDYFTPQTDFGRPMVKGSSFALNLYYHHGADPMVKKTCIGTGVVKMDDKGLWMESQIDLANQFGSMVAKLGKRAQLGYSSGAAGHLVERKAVGARQEITRWCIGEASITPTPCEPLNTVKSMMDTAACKPIKEMMDEENSGMDMMEEEAPVIGDESSPDAFASSMYDGMTADMIHEGFEFLYEKFCEGMHQVFMDGLPKEYLVALVDGFASRGNNLVSTIDAVASAEVKAIEAKTRQPQTVRELEHRLRDSLMLTRSESVRLAKSVWESLRVAATEPDMQKQSKTDVSALEKARILADIMMMEIESED